LPTRRRPTSLSFPRERQLGADASLAPAADPTELATASARHCGKQALALA
jgi:hypothetical protein